MKTILLLSVMTLVAASAPQDKGKYAGFTKSPTEHIINELEQPFEVQSVRGAVTRNGGDREPLKDALIEIKGPGNHDKIRRAKTNENGQFQISHVPEGTYRFKVTLDGFQSVMGTIIVSKKGAKEGEIKIAMLIGV